MKKIYTCDIVAHSYGFRCWIWSDDTMTAKEAKLFDDHESAVAYGEKRLAELNKTKKEKTRPETISTVDALAENLSKMTE